MKYRFLTFGIKHEIAIRWPLQDWYRSNKVARKIDPSIADSSIYNLIIKNEPALVGRLGGTESRFLGEFKKIVSLPYFSSVIFKVKPNWKKRSKEINTNAGFYFKNINEVNEFYSLYKNSLSDTDILGAWGTAFSYIESDFIEEIPVMIPVGMTAPWVQPYSEDLCVTPWAKALEGKKVLVISPFSESIEKQFANINKVFPDYKFHNFELQTLKSPMSINTKYPVAKSWLELLNEIKIKMDKIDFDVALVSAGSYSYPLAHHAKKLGKIGLHAGGGLQLFFGIMGKRWEKSDHLLKIANQDWTRPTQKETPESALMVEGGCYW
jgi:hypothetical protein